MIAHETGIPIMRCKTMAFPEKRRLAAVGDQYMFGLNLLGAPTIDEGKFRTIQFRSAVRRSLWDGVNSLRSGQAESYRTFGYDSGLFEAGSSCASVTQPGIKIW